VNPNGGEAEGRPCARGLAEVTPPVQGSPPPDAALGDDAGGARLRGGRRPAGVDAPRGGAGAVSPEAVALCRERGIEVVDGECPFMFLPDAGWFTACTASSVASAAASRASAMRPRLRLPTTPSSPASSTRPATCWPRSGSRSTTTRPRRCSRLRRGEGRARPRPRPRPLVDRALQHRAPCIRLFDAMGAQTHELGGDACYFTPGSAAIHVLDGATGRIRPPNDRRLRRATRRSCLPPPPRRPVDRLIPADVPEGIQDSFGSSSPSSSARSRW